MLFQKGSKIVCQFLKTDLFPICFLFSFFVETSNSIRQRERKNIYNRPDADVVLSQCLATTSVVTIAFWISHNKYNYLFLLFTINYKTAIYWHVYLIVPVVSDPDFDTQPRFVTLSTNYSPCGFHYRLQIIHSLLWPSVSKSIGMFWLSYL